MDITFHFNLPLNQRLNKDSLTLTVQPESTLLQAIEQLASTLPSHTQALFQPDDNPITSFLVYMVNQQKIHDPSRHRLNNDDQITVLSPMAGG